MGIDRAILIDGPAPEDRRPGEGIYNADGSWRARWKPTPREEDPPPTQAATPPPAQQPDVAETIEVCRSFSRKINLKNYGGLDFESADFFCSRKMTCAREAEAMVSAELLEMCVNEIHSTVIDYIADMRKKLREARERNEARAQEARAQQQRVQQQALVVRPAVHPTRRQTASRAPAAPPPPENVTGEGIDEFPDGW